MRATPLLPYFLTLSFLLTVVGAGVVLLVFLIAAWPFMKYLLDKRFLDKDPDVLPESVGEKGPREKSLAASYFDFEPRQEHFPFFDFKLHPRPSNLTIKIPSPPPPLPSPPPPAYTPKGLKSVAVDLPRPPSASIDPRSTIGSISTIHSVSTRPRANRQAGLWGSAANVQQEPTRVTHGKRHRHGGFWGMPPLSDKTLPPSAMTNRHTQLLDRQSRDHTSDSHSISTERTWKEERLPSFIGSSF